MKEMSKTQRQVAIGAAGLVLLYLLYRYYQSRSTPAASAGVPATDAAASDFAALAGQEQGDVAALQGQNTQLLGQEQSDVAALQAQEFGDVSGLTSGLAGLTTGLESLTSAVTTEQTSIAGLASGQDKINRTLNATVATHPGGPFYKYYKQVTGKNPPARVSATSFLYQAWKAGVKATALQGNKTHPSAPKNTHVAHPNPTHKQQTGGAGVAPGKNTKPKYTPPKPSKPKASGKRK